MSVATERLDPAPDLPEDLPSLSLAQQLRSRLLGLRFAASRALRWQRPGYVEAPATELAGLPDPVAARIADLRRDYDVGFEQRYHRANSLENYVYLDLLDRLRAEAGSGWPQGGDWLDIGSKHFCYAPVLQAALAPSRLTGVEIEGYRLYRDGHSRHDYARHYIDGLPGTDYRVMDAMDWRQPVDGISCLYPFLLPGTVLAWGLPVSVLRPRALFVHLGRCLRPGGHLLMINQGEDEGCRAAALAAAAGLERRAALRIDQPLLPRPAPPVLSLWQRPA